jgi:hypothetical protein
MVSGAFSAGGAPAASPPALDTASSTNEMTTLRMPTVVSSIGVLVSVDMRYSEFLYDAIVMALDFENSLSAA